MSESGHTRRFTVLAAAAVLAVLLGAIVIETGLLHRRGMWHSQLVYLQMPAANPAEGSGPANPSLFSPATFDALRQDRRDFSTVVAFAPLSNDKIDVRYGAIAEQARGVMVSGNFFAGLGVPMRLGGGFTMDDERRHTPAVVLSLAYWTHLSTRNPGLLGQAVYINGVPFAIFGVTAEGFSGVQSAKPTDFWIPLQNRPELTPWCDSAQRQTLYAAPNSPCLYLMARLNPHEGQMMSELTHRRLVAVPVKSIPGLF